jgi:glycosyltransferase involved in cell wall biosynthesis
MSNLKVAMVSPRYHPLTGGVETHLHAVAPRLRERGIDVTILTTDLTGALPPREEVDGVDVRRFAAYPRSRDYYLSPVLLRTLRRGGFDLCHIQGVHDALAPTALAAAHTAGIPTVLTFHTGGSSNPLRKAMRGAQWQAIGPALRRSRRLIAVCEFERRLFSRVRGIEPEQIVVVRNGSERLPVEPTAGAPREGAPLVVSIGRLERYKGHHRVVAAMPHLRRLAPEAQLVVAGSGPFESRLRALAQRGGVEDAVTLCSFTHHQRGELGALIERADVIVLLSEYEAHPIAVMEALAAGRDVLCADTSGLSELGQEGLVRTIPLRAPPHALADALLATASERRWQQGAPQLPTWDECVDALVETYDAALR